MARSVTVLELVNRAKQLADMEGSSFVSAAEWITYASRHLTELWDLLIQASPPDYFAADYTFTATAGQRSYLLPGDFRTLLRVLVLQDGRQRPMQPLRGEERFSSTTPTTGGSITLEYIPAPPVLVSGADTVDGVSGWEELISASMARDAMLKEETDTSVVQSLVDREMMRIRSASANRDRGQPKYIGFRDDTQGSNSYDCGTGLSSLRYRLRGSQIELYSR